MNKNRFTVIVKPNSLKNEVISYDASTNTYKVAIKAPPEDNKANKEVIKFFSKLLKKKVSILIGLKSREKIVEIEE